MLRRRPVPRNAGAVLCLAALLATAGCGDGPVPVDPPSVAGAEAADCSRLVESLPDTVSGQPRRDVEGGTPYAAAWGDPAIVLRCGVGTPEGFDDLSTCQVTNGVGWFVPDEQITGTATEVLMTTVDRSPAIEVRLPPDYFPPAPAMVDLAEAITAHTDQDDPCS